MQTLLRESKMKEMYGAILPIVGAGHEEKNMLIAFQDIVWPVFGEKFALSQGMTSPSLQKVIYKASQHHKTFEVHTILMEGLWLHLIRDFIKERGDKTLDAFMEWWPRSWLADLLLQGLVILFFQKAVRKWCFRSVHACRMVFLPMWFTGSHPIYRLGMCSFIRDYILMPEVLKEKMSEWSFATKTGKHEKYQGADYVLEEYNKTLLRCLCPSPSFPDWFQTTRLIPLIEHVRNEFREKMKRTDTGENERERTPADHSLDLLLWESDLYRDNDFFSRPKCLNSKSELVHQNVFERAKKYLLLYVEKNFLRFQIMMNDPASHNTYMRYQPPVNWGLGDQMERKKKRSRTEETEEGRERKRTPTKK